MANQKQSLGTILGSSTPTAVITTLIYCIPVLASVRTCIEKEVFRRLAECNECLSAAEILHHTSAYRDADQKNKAEQADLLVRLLRPLCALGLVHEAAPSTYQANDLTKALADPGLAAGFELIFDNAMGPSSTMAIMSTYLQSNDFKAPSSADNGPFQEARDSAGVSTFQTWVDQDPVQLSRLNAFMQRLQKDRPHWTDWLLEEALFHERLGTAEEVPVFVDVGGGRGHDLMALAAKYPDMELRLILQDQASVVEEAIAGGISDDPRIEICVHDFFKPQPTSGAHVYYMHKIMHDWPDKECIEILRHLRDAMVPSSRILVNDVILPKEKCSLLPAAFDISMLALHSGRERDEAMWERLVQAVGGLKVCSFWHPPGGEGEGIVEIAKML